MRDLSDRTSTNPVGQGLQLPFKATATQPFTVFPFPRPPLPPLPALPRPSSACMTLLPLQRPLLSLSCSSSFFAYLCSCLYLPLHLFLAPTYNFPFPFLFPFRPSPLRHFSSGLSGVCWLSVARSCWLRQERSGLACEFCFTGH